MGKRFETKGHEIKPEVAATKILQKQKDRQVAHGPLGGPETMGAVAGGTQHASQAFKHIHGAQAPPAF